MKPDELATLLELRDASRRIPYCPHIPHPKQREFLALETLEGCYGGAASGGKSDALLMAALQYVHVPGYSAILFRRTHQDLSLAGALMSRADEWLRPYGNQLRWNGTDKQWRFPSGAILSFGYMDTDEDRFRYKSAEYQFVGFDELTTFSEVQYTYMGSRLRRLVGSTIPIRLRGATNPGDRGHKWVKDRFLAKPDPRRPFIPAKVHDNPSVDAVSYIATMEATLDETTLAQLRDGLWIIDDGARLIAYNAAMHDVAELPAASTGGWHRVFVVDIGASTKDATTSFTRLTYHDQIPDDVFVEFSYKEAKHTPTSIAERVERELEEVGGDLTVVFDEGALGHAYGNDMRSRYGVPVIAAEKSEKRANIRMLNGSVQRGHVHFIAGKCTDLQSECETVIYDKHGLDAAPGLANHCLDGLLYGWRWTYAHRSQAPSQQPVIGSDAWYRAEEQRRIEAEYERAERRRRESPWASPNRDGW